MINGSQPLDFMCEFMRLLVSFGARSMLPSFAHVLVDGDAGNVEDARDALLRRAKRWC